MRRLSRRQRTAALVLAVLAACFITLDVGGSSLGTAHSGVRGLLGGLYRGTDSVLGPVRRYVQDVPHAGSDGNRIRSLEQQNAALRKQLDDERVDRKTAAQLARLRLAATSTRHRVLPTRVIAMDPAAGFDWTVTVDIGRSDGARVGQTVTDGAGLVGRVLHVDDSTAVVLLAVDPGSGVGARDLRSGQLGVATGAGADGFTFRPLDPKARLRVGDRISTGPAGASSFVAGLAVGTIRAVRASTDGTTIASVQPEVAPAAVDLVGLIVANGQDARRTALDPAHLAGR
jgi:rod shape-determining protein MreC